ncbi:unnamed protein product [Urochloa humidicola]
MDQDRPRRRCCRRRRHRRRSAEDHISGLPDELLHSILLRLSSTQAAARTSVLSRRWRPIWTHLPELIFGNASHDDPPPPLPVASSFLDVVDGALAACAAPTLQAFVVVLPTGLNIPAGRVAPWLRFASERVVGELILLGRTWPHELQVYGYGEEEDVVLELPTCERAKTITLRLEQDWWLRLRPTGGLFTALTSLRILFVRMKGSDLTALVCTQCPCLRELTLCYLLVDSSDVSIHSDSLHRLSFLVMKARQLEVITPRLEYLYVGEVTGEARIFAPMLARVVWCVDTYDHTDLKVWVVT